LARQWKNFAEATLIDDLFASAAVGISNKLYHTIFGVQALSTATTMRAAYTIFAGPGAIS